jgi:hypothetical protein
LILASSNRPFTAQYMPDNIASCFTALACDQLHCINN